MTMAAAVTTMLRYYAAEHPSVARFRWDYDLFGGTWWSLAVALMAYWAAAAAVAVVMWKVRKAPLSLGPLPALYNLSVLATSTCLLIGCWQAAHVEIQETRWLWRRSKTALDWMMCFPLGTRPAGRVFFWSYAFYLSKYYQLLESFLLLLQRRPVGFLRIFVQPVMVLTTCFIWLEFSQSLQIMAILAHSALQVLLYLHLSMASCSWPPLLPHGFLRWCRLAQLAFMAIASARLLRLHFQREGCNGMASWAVATLLNAATLLPLLFRPSTVHTNPL